LNRPTAPDALPPLAGAENLAHRIAASALREPTTGEFGALAGQIQQMQRDRQAIIQIVQGLPGSERDMLPDVVQTVDSLVSRAGDLAGMLQQMEGNVDDGALARLDERIETLQRDGADPESDRRLELLQRQRSTLAELVDRRKRVGSQFESCVLAVQNVRFDLLRLRSAGVQAVIDDLTSATQEARALQIDVEAALDAAGEIKQALGRI
jgi:hypothetical protein